LPPFSPDGFAFPSANNVKITYTTLYYNFARGSYVHETLSPTLREGHRHRVFENRVLRRIFGQMRAEVTREWRKLHDEIRNSYSSTGIIRKPRRITWVGHMAQIWGIGTLIGNWSESHK
jgi:hypothetical protein